MLWRSLECSALESITLLFLPPVLPSILARVPVPGNLCYTPAHAKLAFSIRNRRLYSCGVDYLRGPQKLSLEGRHLGTPSSIHCWFPRTVLGTRHAIFFETQ